MKFTSLKLASTAWAILSMWGVFSGSDAFGASGSQVVGVSPSARAMGGIGVGGKTALTETFYKNPAALSNVAIRENAIQTESSFTLLGLSTEGNIGAGAASQSGITPIPTFAVAYGMGDLTIGFALFGYAGVNQDTRKTTLLNGIRTSYRVTRLALAGSYKLTPKISFGIEPFVTFSDLALATASPSNSRSPHGAFGAGVQAGLIAALTEELNAGVNFTSGSRVTHANITDIDAFGPAGDGVVDPFTVTAPMDLGVGFHYKANENLEIGLDYHHVFYGSAAGYSDFLWKNSHEFALGAGYRTGSWVWRGGFNYTTSPIENTSGETGTDIVQVQGKNVFRASISQLNAIAFPAFTQANITVGTGYDFSQDVGVDFAFLYAPKVTRTRAGTLGATPYSFVGSASQWGLSAGLRYQM